MKGARLMVLLAVLLAATAPGSCSEHCIFPHIASFLAPRLLSAELEGNSSSGVSTHCRMIRRLDDTTLAGLASFSKIKSLHR